MRMIENVFGTEGEEKVFADTHILDSDVTWKNFCETMNDLILRNNNAMISCEDKRLGTHFVSKDELEIHGTDGLKNRRFPEKVIKYLWDDAFKLSRDQIFNADYNSLESLINNFISKEKNSKFDIFKDDVKEIILNRDADEKK